MLSKEWATGNWKVKLSKININLWPNIQDNKIYIWRIITYNDSFYYYLIQNVLNFHLRYFMISCQPITLDPSSCFFVNLAFYHGQVKLILLTCVPLGSYLTSLCQYHHLPKEDQSTWVRMCTCACTHAHAHTHRL